MAPIRLIEEIASTQHGVATVAQCKQVGLSEGRVRSLCRSKQWLRLNHGAYYVAIHDGTAPRIAHIHAAVLSAGPHAVAVLETAAELHGIAGLRTTEDIHLSVPGAAARGRRCIERSLQVHQFALRTDELTVVQGIPVTTAVRTVADLVVRTDRMHAVAMLDSCLNRRVLLPTDVEDVRLLIAGRRGVTRARPWFDEVDGRAESPLETRVRLRAADGGFPPDELQFRVRDGNGQVVAIADFAWFGAKVIGEADGAAVHDTPDAVFRDRRRQNAIVAAGYFPVRFTWDDTLTAAPVPRAIFAAVHQLRG